MSKYTQLISEELREQIEQYIDKNQLKPGDKLPSERRLTELFSASRSTLREALRHMQNEGQIISIHGKGNFIAPPKFNENAKQFISFSSGWNFSGYTVSNQVINFELLEAPKKVSLNLDLTIGTLVYRLQRIRFLNHLPLCVETTYLPFALFPNLTGFNFENNSLYDVLEQYYQIKLTHQEQKISITKLNTEEAKLLQMKEGDAAFHISSISHTGDNKPIEYCIAVYCADRYSITSELGPEP